MHTQLSMFGGGNGRQPPRAQVSPLDRDVIFFALLLGRQLQAPLRPLTERLRREFGVRAPLLPHDRLHVSVIGIGFSDDLSAEDVAAARRAVALFDFVPFELSFVEVLSWARGRGPRPIVLLPGAGSELVTDLGERLAAAMFAEAFDPRGLPPTTPHLTLGYDIAHVPKTTLIPPIRVRVDGVSLVRSHRGEGRYTVLA
jgi:2'-5' RNA ligase